MEKLKQLAHALLIMATILIAAILAMLSASLVYKMYAGIVSETPEGAIIPAAFILVATCMAIILALAATIFEILIPANRR